MVVRTCCALVKGGTCGKRVVIDGRCISHFKKEIIGEEVGWRDDGREFKRQFKERFYV